MPFRSESYCSAISVIASAVGEDARREFLESSFEAGPSDAANTPHLQVLCDALRQRNVLAIDYTSLAGRAWWWCGLSQVLAGSMQNGFYVSPRGFFYKALKSRALDVGR